MIMVKFSLFGSILATVTQGVTEVLPISSSAHLVLLSLLWPISHNFIIFLHFGSFLGFFYYYKKVIYQLFKGFLAEVKVRKWGSYSNFACVLIIAILPAILLGILESQNKGTDVISASVLYSVGISLIVGGVVLRLLEFKEQDKDISEAAGIFKIRKRQALIIGLLQTLSLFTGVSRLAACLVGGALAGLPLKTTVHFSFITSLPLIFGAWCLSLLQGKLAQFFY